MRASIILVSVLSTLASACLYPRAEEKPPFSYTGETGPMGWHLLPNNTICGTGKQQSPINISPKVGGVVVAKELKLNFPKFSKEIEVLNTGSTILFTPKDGDNYTSVLEGKEYKLLQFHFHTPSEHRFLDESYPLEVHFVHQDKEGKLAVVGVFFNLGYDWGDRLLGSTTHALKALQEPGSKKTIEDVCFSSIMSTASESKVYTYPGSLTTPPCSEGVTWYVVEDVLSMSVAQFQAWKSVMKFNSRNTQNAPGLPNLVEYALGASPVKEKPTEEKPKEEKPKEEKPKEEKPKEEKPTEEQEEKDEKDEKDETNEKKDE